MNSTEELNRQLESEKGQKHAPNGAKVAGLSEVGPEGDTRL